MAVTKDAGKWKVDLRPHGRSGKRVRKWFDSKAEALRFERFVLAKSNESKDWNPSPRDKRPLSELIDIWFAGVGIHLKDGERRRTCLKDIAALLNDPPAIELKPSDVVTYKALKKEQGIADKTLNNHLGYLNAVYNYLFKVGETAYENPIRHVDPIRLDEKELAWLTTEQIDHLLQTISEFSLNPHVLMITKLCLATGARWGEVEGLSPTRLTARKLIFVNTKSGKSRAVPISGELFSEARLHLEEWGGFSHSLSAFRRALVQSEIKLPKGQSAHVLRHTFASHFMMNGGNILTLQKILGHASINMTMRYAHLSPDHLQDAVTLNPLSRAKDV